MIVNPGTEAVRGVVQKFHYDKARDGLDMGIVVQGVGLIIEIQGAEIDRLLLALHEGGFEGLQATEKTLKRFPRPT